MSPRKEKCSAQIRTRAEAGVMLVMLLLCGDIETNLGPNYEYPCGVCGKPVQCNQKGVECELWHHTHCIGMSDSIYQYLRCHEDPWFCFRCSLPQLSVLNTTDKGHSQAHTPSSIQAIPPSPLFQPYQLMPPQENRPTMHILSTLF